MAARLKDKTAVIEEIRKWKENRAPKKTKQHGAAAYTDLAKAGDADLRPLRRLLLLEEQGVFCSS